MLRHLGPVPVALLLVCASLALALTACGSSDKTTTTAAQTTVTAPAKGRFTVRQIVKLVGLKPAADGKSWTSMTGCKVTVIMTTHAEVLTYRTTQDQPVVTNDRDDVGVKFDPVPGCREALTANLTRVK